MNVDCVALDLSGPYQKEDVTGKLFCTSNCWTVGNSNNSYPRLVTRVGVLAFPQCAEAHFKDPPVEECLCKATSVEKKKY